MKVVMNLLFGRMFGNLDRSIVRLQEIRDSYQAMNVEIYGEQLANILNDW